MSSGLMKAIEAVLSWEYSSLVSNESPDSFEFCLDLDRLAFEFGLYKNGTDAGEVGGDEEPKAGDEYWDAPDRLGLTWTI